MKCSSSLSSPLCRVFILIFPRQTMSLGNSVAAILLLLFMVLIPLVSVLNLLYFYISIFRSTCAIIIIIIIIIIILVVVVVTSHVVLRSTNINFQSVFPLVLHVCHYKALRIKSSQSLQGSCRNHTLCRCNKSLSVYHTCF